MKPSQAAVRTTGFGQPARANGPPMTAANNPPTTPANANVIILSIALLLDSRQRRLTSIVADPARRSIPDHRAKAILGPEVKHGTVAVARSYQPYFRLVCFHMSFPLVITFGVQAVWRDLTVI